MGVCIWEYAYGSMHMGVCKWGKKLNEVVVRKITVKIEKHVLVQKRELFDREGIRGAGKEEIESEGRVIRKQEGAFRLEVEEADIGGEVNFDREDVFEGDIGREEETNVSRVGFGVEAEDFPEELRLAFFCEDFGIFSGFKFRVFANRRVEVEAEVIEDLGRVAFDFKSETSIREPIGEGEWKVFGVDRGKLIFEGGDFGLGREPFVFFLIANNIFFLPEVFIAIGVRPEDQVGCAGVFHFHLSVGSTGVIKQEKNIPLNIILQ